MNVVALSLAALLAATAPALARSGHSPVLAAAVGGAAVAGVAAEAIFADPPAWQGPPQGDGIPGTGAGRAALMDRSAAEDCASAGASALVRGLKQAEPAAAQPAGDRTQFVLAAPDDRAPLPHEGDGRPVTCRGRGLLARP